MASNAQLASNTKATGGVAQILKSGYGTGKKVFSLPWGAGFTNVGNFAILPVKSLSNGTHTGSDNANIVTFEIQRQGDMVTEVYLQVTIPACSQSGTGYLGGYVWGLGFAMLESAKLEMNGTLQETITGHYAEMYDEVHNHQGESLGAMVFKFDDVDNRDMAQLSSSSRTLYVPIPFFFTHHVYNALKIVALSYSSINITLRLRPLSQLLWTIKTVCSASGSTMPTNPAWGATEFVDNVSHNTAAGGGGETGSSRSTWDWNHFAIAVITNQVFLEDHERLAVAQKKHREVLSTVQYCGSGEGADNIAESMSGTETHFTQMASSITLNHPVKNLMFALRDQTWSDIGHTCANLATTPISCGSSTKAVQGVLSLNGSHVRSSKTQMTGMLSAPLARGFSVGGNDAAGHNLTVSINAGTLAVADNEDVVFPTSHKFKKNGESGGVLLYNRFEYRAANAGAEIEPCASVDLKLNGISRTTAVEDLQGAYYGAPSQHFHCARVARKGIYCIPLSLQCSNFNTGSGSINFSMIGKSSIKISQTASNSTDAGISSDLFLFAENWQIWKTVHGVGGFQFQS